MDPPAPRVRSDASMSEVQNIMNNAQGEERWVGNSKRWQNLRTARNDFTRARLHEEKISTKQYKLLPKPDKRYYAEKIEVAFSADDDGFYQYTRDGYWMQLAVGDDGSWIKIEGMASWHIRQALNALEAASNGSATPPYSSGQFPPEPGSSSQAPPFDPVRESARDNTANQ